MPNSSSLSLLMSAPAMNEILEHALKRSLSAQTGLCLAGCLPAPDPVPDFRPVLAVFVNVGFVVDELVANSLFGVGGARTEARHAIDDIAGQVKSVELIQHYHIEWGS